MRNPIGKWVVNRGHPLAKCLVAAFIADGSGRMVDLVRGVRLNTVGSASTVSNIAGRAGNCNGTRVGFQLTCPSHLKYNYPVTLIWVGVPLQTMASAPLFAINLNNTGASPFVSYALSTAAGGLFVCNYGNSGTFTTITATTNSSGRVGQLTVVGASIRVGGSALYINGKSEATGSVATNPTFTSTSQLDIGVFSNQNNNGQAQCNLALMYNRVLTAAEHRAIASDPWQMLRLVSRPDRWAASVAAAGITGEGAAWFGGAAAAGAGATLVSGQGATTTRPALAAGAGGVAISGQGAAAFIPTGASGAGAVRVSGQGAAWFRPTIASGSGTTLVPATFTYSYRQNSTARPPTSYTSTSNLNDGSVGDTSTGESHTGSATFGAGCAWQTVTGIISAAAECVPFATISAGQFTWAGSSSANAASTCIVPPDPPAETGEIIDFGAAYSLDGSSWTALSIGGDTTAPNGTATLSIPSPIIARYVHVWVRTRRIEYDELDTHAATATISDLRFTATAAPTIQGEGATWFRPMITAGDGALTPVEQDCSCTEWTTAAAPACPGWESSAAATTDWSQSSPTATTWTRGRCT